MQNSIKVQNAANALRLLLKNVSDETRIGLVLGTGLGGIAELVESPVSVPFRELPDFPTPGVASHTGRFVAGTIAGTPVIIQQGRCHLYEGYSPAEVCMGVRVMASLGVSALIVTNAAGALNPLFDAGSVMLITDHINFTGASPLTGPNNDDAGPRFPDMSAAYDRELSALAAQAALEAGLALEKGVYLSLPGPQLETPAETRAFRLLGADAIGMSSVLEVIAARHMGLRVIGFSCLSNKNTPDCMAETSLEEIIRVSGEAGTKLTTIIARLLGKL